MRTPALNFYTLSKLHMTSQWSNKMIVFLFLIIIFYLKGPLMFENKLINIMEKDLRLSLLIEYKVER